MSELMMMLLADARLPTGAHTQSAGLEPALRAGMPASAVPAYIRARLRTVTLLEAAAAVLAMQRTVDAATHLTQCRAEQVTEVDDRRRAEVDANALAGVSAQGVGGHSVQGVAGLTQVEDRRSADLAAALTEIDAAWRARTVSPALRETSVLLGRGYTRLIRQLWPGTVGAKALSVIGRPGRAVVLGVAAGLAGLSRVQLIRLIGYDDAQTVAAATLKLEPLDPVAAAKWVMAAGPHIEQMVEDLAQVHDSEQMPAWGAPLIEQWAQVHATTSQRLFRA
jgi:urease accessory protein